MMRDRLLHMRRLLREDGSIWVHLDDVENHRMRVLLDEIFGPENFQAEVVWQKADSPRSDAKGFSSDHDVLLVYGRATTSFNRMNRTEAENSRFTNPDNDPLGRWFSDNRTAPGAATHQGMVHGIQHPITGEFVYPGIGRCWTFSQADLLQDLKEWADYELRDIGDAYQRARICGVPVESVRANVCAIALRDPLDIATKKANSRRLKGGWTRFYVTETSFGRKSYIPSAGTPPRTWWANDQVGHNRSAKSEMKALFPGKAAFATPKPERLLERIIHIGSNPGDIVLDVFAGSGTTAAVAHKMGRRWVTCELIDDTVKRFTRPRLEKVVNDQDPGGITRTAGERVPADGVELPEGMTAQDAQKFTSALNKLVAENPDLAKSAQVKELKALAKTAKTKETVNWRGGGSFQVAHLAPACFDYDEDLDRVILTDAATGNVLVESVAANLGFTLEMDDLYFDGYRGRTMLKVHEGVLDVDTADELLSHLAEDEKLVIATTGVVDGVREHLRKRGKGSKVVHIPDDIFRYSEEGEER